MSLIFLSVLAQCPLLPPGRTRLGVVPGASAVAVSLPFTLVATSLCPDPHSPSRPPHLHIYRRGMGPCEDRVPTRFRAQSGLARLGEEEKEGPSLWRRPLEKRGRGQDAQADRSQISYLHRRYFLYLITHPASSLPAGRGKAGESQGP